MKKILLLITIMTVILSACHNVTLDDKLNVKTFSEDIKTLAEKKAISESDKDLLLSNLNKTNNISSFTKYSYGELLSLIKQELKRELLEKAREKADEDFSSSALGHSF